MRDTRGIFQFRGMSATSYQHHDTAFQFDFEIKVDNFFLKKLLFSLSDVFLMK